MYPFIVNKIVFPLQEFVKRKPTFEYLRALERSQWLSPTELGEIQLRRLAAQLDFAYRQVPYYRELFDKIGLRPGQIGSPRELARIPYLDKEVIRSRREELQPKTRIPGTQQMSTGGSTGSPVAVFVDRSRAAFTDAVRMRAHRWFGVDTGAREIALWGSPIELGRQDVVRNLRDRLVNSRFLAAFNMGQETMEEYAGFIQRYQPETMYGYASAFYLLAQYLEHKSWLAPAPLKAIFATAEPL
ncbi:MAG: phenylacetate--CoA ligase family protein, partial [Candidatus Binatia bacterium]